MFRSKSKMQKYNFPIFLFVIISRCFNTSHAIQNEQRQQHSSLVTSKSSDINKENTFHTSLSSSTTKTKLKSNAVTAGMKNFLASSLAAAASKTLLAPFDTIKTMQQQVTTNQKGLSILEAGRLICSRPGGCLELYAGLGVSAIGAMPSVGLYFGVYSYSKSILYPLLLSALSRPSSTRIPSNDQPPTPVIAPETIRMISVATSAAIGNTVASFSRVPYEVVKQKLQTGLYSNTFEAIRDLMMTNGVRSFFPTGGISVQMIRDIPYAIFTLLSYEYLREHWVMKNSYNNHMNGDSRIGTSTNGSRTKSQAKPWRDMVAGAVAGGVGSYLTNPMDVLKTRLQVDSALYNGSVWKCMVATYEEGGYRAFLRGSVPRLCHKVPANGAFFVFYEFFRRLLNVEMEEGGK